MRYSNEENAPILITGGTGKTGRRIAERLAAAGQAIRIGSRRSAPAFDWEDAAGWQAALRGVFAVYISYYPDLLAPEALGRVETFSRLAVASGVQRLVLLSGRNEPAAQAAEQVVMRVAQQAGADWTILRCGWFAQNFSESLLLDPVRYGEVVLPAGDIPEPFIDADDIADVAVAALTQPGHAGQLYELTGPRLLTMAEATAEIAHALGRAILSPGLRGGFPGADDAAGPAARTRRRAGRTLHHRAGWPQRLSLRWRAARAGPAAARPPTMRGIRRRPASGTSR